MTTQTHTHQSISIVAAGQQLSGNHLLKVIMERRKRSDALRAAENRAPPDAITTPSLERCH